MNATHHPPARILVVDDEEVVRLAHRRVLAGTPFFVETVTSGSAALCALERECFDVVLLDLRMPGMDGLAVLSAIKARWPASEVVVITGYPSVETATEAVRRGAYDYLAKPLEPASVIDATSRAVRQKRWSLQREALPA